MRSVVSAPSLFAAVTALSSLAGAQETERVLDARLRVAGRQQAEAVAQVAEYSRRMDSSAWVATDTVRLLDGAIVVGTDAANRALVEQGAARSDSLLRRRLGSMRPTPISLIVQYDSTGYAPGIYVRTKLASGGERVTNSAQVASSIVRQVVWALQLVPATRCTPSRLKPCDAARNGTLNGVSAATLWLGHGLPDNPPDDHDWSGARLDLGISASFLAKACLAGDIAACKSTLGFTPAVDPPTEWYDAAGRRQLVLSYSRIGPFNTVERDRCAAGSDPDCLAFIRRRDMRNASAPPGTGRVRNSLVLYALTAGGDGSLGRLAASRATAPEALAAAANMPLDSLLASWRRQVHDRGVASDALSWTIAGVAVGWIVLLIVLSSWSPRWR